MNAIESLLKVEERKYEEGLLFAVQFCNAVVACLVGKKGDEYDLRKGLSAKSISHVVKAMNVMNLAAVAGEPVFSVGSSATLYENTENIPRYLAVASVWEDAGWIEPATSGDNDERWQSVRDAGEQAVV